MIRISAAKVVPVSVAVQKGACHCRSAIIFSNLSFFFSPSEATIEEFLMFDVTETLIMGMDSCDADSGVARRI